MNEAPGTNEIGVSGPLAEHMAETIPPRGSSRQRDWLKIQQAMVAIGRRAIALPSLSVLMHDSAALIANTLDVECYATAEPEVDGEALLVTLNVGPGGNAEPQVFAKRIDNAVTNSLVQRALRKTHPLAVDDFLASGSFQDPFLQGHGIRSAVAAPLITDCQSHGVLVAGSVDPGRFQTEELLCMETVAHLVSTTIARSLTEKALAEERQSTSAAPTGPDRSAAMGGHGTVPRDERRRSLRLSYRYHQMIAPITGGKLPRESDFTRVCCHDISVGGFSYLASEPPVSNEIIVALGRSPRLTYVVAQVAHLTRIGHGAKKTYIVGCSYMGRASY